LEVGTSITTHATFELWEGFGTRMPPTKEKAGVAMPPKKEKAGVAKNKTAEDGGAENYNWLIGSWRRRGHTAFDPAAVAAKAVTLGLHTAAVTIAPKSVGSGPQTKTATKKQTADVDASRKKSAIAASAASLVSQ
jgi:hypothetical protein